jgi:hypothetical protein
MYLFWVLMILTALGSINAQLKARTMNLEAYSYKKS